MCKYIYENFLFENYYTYYTYENNIKLHLTT